jgi:hypothetical protein
VLPFVLKELPGTGNRSAGKRNTYFGKENPCQFEINMLAVFSAACMLAG